MMYPENPSLSHYLMNFMLYTLGAVGLIYAAFWYIRQQVGKTQKQPHNESPPEAAALESAAPPSMPLGVGTGLEIESVLPMESQQTLYVLRAGRERFLLSVSGEKTNLLSRLENAAVEETSGAQLPWFTVPPAEQQAVTNAPKLTASSRLVESIRWLVSARSGGH
jgi:hypothetical protein